MEINHLLALDGGDLQIHDTDAVLEKINFWLDSPAGEYWGRPEWGNRYGQFKHEPMDSDASSFEVAMENVTIRDLERDLPGVLVLGIRVSRVDVDNIVMTIKTNFGQLTRELFI
jgi:hypothetical protein